MTSAHIIFIPAVLVVGIVIGFIIGSRSAREAILLEKKREQERQAAREKRAARKAEKAKARGESGAEQES